MIRIFATDASTGERIEITDLYWFEEEGVHDFGGEGDLDRFTFEVFVGETKVYPVE